MSGPIICPGHSRPVPDVKFSKINEGECFIVSGCLDGKAMLRDGVTGDWIGTFLGHKGAVWSASVNEDITKCVTASADFTAKLWDAETGNCLDTYNHKHIVKTAAFSLKGEQVYTGGAEKKIRVINIEGSSSPTELQGHEETITGICLTQDPNLIVSCGNEKNARIWDLRTNEIVKTLNTDQPISGMSSSNDGSTLACTYGNTVSIWDSGNFELLKSFDLPRKVDCVAYDPALKKIITGSSSELWVRGYDYETGEEFACNKGHHGPVRSVAFCPNGDSYVSGSEDGTLRIWSYSE